MVKVSRRLALAGLVGLIAGSAPAIGHNNPGFREDLILTIEVSPVAASDGGGHSAPFTLELPKKTIELIWRIDAPDPAAIRFSVANGEGVIAEGLGDGDNSRIARDEVMIVDVTGATEGFRLEIYANVIDRSSKTES